MTASDNLRDYYGRELLLKCDKNWKVTYVSENSIKILGYSQDEIINTYINYEIDCVFKNSSDGKDISYKFYKKDGTEIILDININEIIDSDGVIERIITARDVTKYYNKYKENQRIIDIINRSKGLIYRYEIYPEKKFSYITPYTRQIGGYSVEEVLNDKNFPLSALHPEDKDIFESKLNGTADYNKPFQTRYLNKKGQYIWLEEFVTPIYENGILIAIEATCRDISEIKCMENKLLEMSYTDFLTGLYNKAYLEKYINQINGDSIPLGVIYCDLDNLKIINDKFGHYKGDELIINISNILMKIFSDNAVTIRLGGDEFLILIEKIVKSEMKFYYNELMKQINKHNEINVDIPIEISIGMSYSDDVANDIHNLIKKADENMYKNKKHRKMAAL